MTWQDKKKLWALLRTCRANVECQYSKKKTEGPLFTENLKIKMTNLNKKQPIEGSASSFLSKFKAAVPAPRDPMWSIINPCVTTKFGYVLK